MFYKTFQGFQESFDEKHIHVLQGAKKPYFLHQVNQHMNLKQKDVGKCISNKVRRITLSFSIIRSFYVSTTLAQTHCTNLKR
jgi:hypothetical protein